MALVLLSIRCGWGVNVSPPERCGYTTIRLDWQTSEGVLASEIARRARSQPPMSDLSIWALFVIVLANTVFIAGICVALFTLYRKLAEVAAKVDPLAARAGEVLGRVEQITEQV